MVLYQVTPRQLKIWLEDSTRLDPFLIDIREKEYFNKASLPGALSWPEETFLDEAKVFPHKLHPCVIFCAGYDLAFAAGVQMYRMGFTQVFVLLGGFTSWQKRFPRLK